MATLQIRLAQDHPLWSIAQDLVLRIEAIFSKHPDIVPPRAGHIYTITHGVLRRFRDAIDAYGVCGTHPRCHSRSTPAQMSESRNQPPPGKDQRILLLTEDVDALSTCLAADVFDRLCPKASTRQWLSLKPEIDAAIQDALAPLLYKNPFCDHCPRCTPGDRMDPWRVKRRTKRRE